MSLLLPPLLFVSLQGCTEGWRTWPDSISMVKLSTARTSWMPRLKT